MPCDRHAILAVTETMLQLRIFHESSQSVNAWRCWRAYKAYWLQGLSTSSSYSVAAVHPQHAASEPDPQQKLAAFLRANKLVSIDDVAAEPDPQGQHKLAAFLRANKFASVNDVSNGISPLMCASAAGDPVLVRALLAQGADVTTAYKGEPIVNLALVRGMTALHLGAAAGQNAACVALLLRYKASLDTHAGRVGVTPLQCAAAMSEAAVRALAEGCVAAGVPLNINAGARLNNASALNIAAFMGPLAAVTALLALGANVSHVNDNGSSVLSDACQNPQTTVETLELIKRHGGTNAINMQCRPRTRRWVAIGAPYL
jgi:hypothetical protein